MINIDALYEQGQAMLKAEHAANEKAKIGTLRGGSVGALLYGTTPVGTCPRKAYLRFKGIDLDDTEDNRHLMFEGGLANEDIWAKILSLSLPKGFELLREEDCPSVWTLPSGTKVTGRPDLMIVKDDEAKTPVIGIELKAVCAMWTAKDILAERKPKLMHMLQASHYSRILGVPWELWYTSRTDFTISRESWQQQLFAKVPDEYIEKREDSKGKLIINKVMPFRKGFRLEWKGDQLLFSEIGVKGIKHSVITWQAIEAFYSMVDNVDNKGMLPPRPTNMDIMGKDGGYDICDKKYCVLSGICDKYETSLSRWLAAVEGSLEVIES